MFFYNKIAIFSHIDLLISNYSRLSFFNTNVGFTLITLYYYKPTALTPYSACDCVKSSYFNCSIKLSREKAE